MKSQDRWQVDSELTFDLREDKRHYWRKGAEHLLLWRGSLYLNQLSTVGHHVSIFARTLAVTLAPSGEYQPNLLVSFNTEDLEL